MSKFVDVSNTKKSSIWRYFWESKASSEAQCQLCQRILKATGGSTKGLMDHLKLKHYDIYNQIQIQKASEPVTKRQRMDEIFKPKIKMDIQERISRFCAQDLISFSTLCNSKQIHEFFSKLGFNGPKAHKTVRKYVLEESQKVKNEVIEKLKKLKEDGKRFSCTTDEYTCTSNRRFININVHTGGDYFSLGLVRVTGSCPAETMIELFTKRLSEFGLDMKTDIIATTTDGASSMKKFGRKTDPVHFQCYAHALQLAIQKVLYVPKKKKILEEERNVELEEDLAYEQSDNDSEYDDDNEDGLNFEEEIEDEVIKEYFDLIELIRKMVRKFRKSPVKNDMFLQPEVQKELGKELKLILDCKTRWGSMYSMLKRFLQVNKQLKHAMIMMEESYDITDEDIGTLEELCNALEPINELSLVLGRMDTTILDSEAMIGLTIELLDQQGTEISSRLKEALVREILKRRNTTLVHLFEYLKDPDYIKKRKDIFGEPIQKFEIVELAQRLHERLFPVQVKQEVNEAATDDELDQDQHEDKPLTTKEKFALALKQSKACSSGKLKSGTNGEMSNKKRKKSKICSNLIEKEMAVYEDKENTKFKRPHNLENLYQALLTIPPTSIESERSFSATGLFMTKLRSRLGDTTLNALVFLRDYYKREERLIKDKELK